MDRLRAGLALYNVGEYLAAHEPIESLWLEEPAGDRDDCLQGLIQATAAVHKSETGNRTGATGLAKSAVEYLRCCDGVDVDDLRTWLSRLAHEPELGTRERPPEIRLDGESVTVDDLPFSTVSVAARALAETRDDEVALEAIEYAASDFAAGSETSPFVALTVDYVRSENPIVGQRLKEHVERRRMRESDVEGLF